MSTRSTASTCRSARRDVRSGRRVRVRQVDPRAGRSCGWSSRPTGSVVFDGVDVAALERGAAATPRRRMQMVFQDPMSSLDPRQSVESLLIEGLRAHGLAERQGDDAATAAGDPGARSACPPSALSSIRTSSPAGSGSASASPGRWSLGPGSDRRRRAGVRPGRVDPGPGAQPAGGPPGRARADLPGHRARPRRRRAHLRHGRGDVPRGLVEESEAGELYDRPAAPLHPGADVGGSRARPARWRTPRADPARRGPAVAVQPAARLPVPHPLSVARSRPAATTSARSCGLEVADSRAPGGVPLARRRSQPASSRRTTSTPKPTAESYAGEGPGPGPARSPDPGCVTGLEVFCVTVR